MRPLSSPPTLGGAVAEHLRTAIVAGEIPPGQLLKESELAQRLGVSATPIREALGELSAEGLVEIEPNRLKRVAPIDPVATLDLFRVQTALWRMGYVWGLPHVDAGKVARLEEMLASYEAGLNQGDRLAAIRAGHAFHTIFIEASGNSELLRVTLDRRSLIARFILLRGKSSISRSGLRQHQAVLQAFREGDTQLVLDRQIGRAHV